MRYSQLLIAAFDAVSLLMGNAIRAEAKPEVATDLRKRLQAWYREVDAKFLQAGPGGPQPWRPAD
jgi:hypothetical protein